MVKKFLAGTWCEYVSPCEILPTMCNSDSSKQYRVLNIFKRLLSAGLCELYKVAWLVDFPQVGTPF